MGVETLQVRCFRNLLSTELQFSQQFNLFYGLNGSGKTSVLEALAYLGLGQSFRTSNHARVNRYDASGFSVFGRIAHETPLIPVGLEWSLANKLRIRIAGEEGVTRSALAEMLPLQIMTSHSHSLLSMGAEHRRRFINWGLFHVEPRFLTSWRRVQRVLKQRNILLRAPVGDTKQLRLWDLELATVAEHFSKMQATYLRQLLPYANRIWQTFIQSDQQPIDMSFYRGWSAKHDLVSALLQALDGDLRSGYTRFGPHRSDLLLRINKYPVQDILSRGQQKLLVYSLKLAQGALLKEQTNKACVYLLDDLSAELDGARCQLLGNYLRTLGAQVFITGISQEALLQGMDKGCPKTKMFHVEQGNVACK